MESEESSDLVHETTLGQEALLRYYNEYEREDLESAVQHFERAWRNCPLTHRCRAVVLVNLGQAKFVRHRIDPKSTDFDELILLYRDALELRRPGHPDRPATLLQLAQTLLYRYEKEGCDESVADEIRELMTEPQTFSENSHECRAADLILDTLERCRVVNSGSVAELEELVQRLKRSAAMPPDGYFDRPQRLINLGIALWKRYGELGELSDLEHSSEKCEQALQLLPSRHPDRFLALRTLTAILWELFQTHGNVSHLKKLSTLCEEALQLIPGRHPKRVYCDASELLQHPFRRRTYERTAQVPRAILLRRRSASATQPRQVRTMTRRLRSTLRLYHYRRLPMGSLSNIDIYLWQYKLFRWQHLQDMDMEALLAEGGIVKGIVRNPVWLVADSRE